MNSPLPASAGLFHAGNTCPYCQETVSAGQLILTCPECGSIHHETCWAHKQGCSSYHCDRSVQMNNPNRSADIVLTFEDVSKAPATIPRIKRSAEDVSNAFLPPKPTRVSRLAVAAAAATAVSCLGILGAFQGSVQIMLLGTVIAFCAIGLGVMAVLFINNPENRISGLGLAVGSTIGPVVLVLIYIIVLNSQFTREGHVAQMNYKMRENLPKEPDITLMPAPVANAMRANVVIHHSTTLGDQSMGSGVVLRYTNHTAVIITNKHVIGNAKDGEIKILFYTGEESSGKIEWTAPEGVDLALLSCSVLTLEKYQSISCSTQYGAAGMGVFAVGNPMGLSWTYTEGALSGRRTIEGGPDGVDLYQTQTPINFGNSGGGLYTKTGTLIGINTMTQDKQKSEGLSFAICINMLEKLLKPEERAKWLAPTPEVEGAPAPAPAPKAEKF